MRTTWPRSGPMTGKSTRCVEKGGTLVNRWRAPHGIGSPCMTTCKGSRQGHDGHPHISPTSGNDKMTQVSSCRHVPVMFVPYLSVADVLSDTGHGCQTHRAMALYASCLHATLSPWVLLWRAPSWRKGLLGH